MSKPFKVNIRTPFFAAQKYVGIDSKDCVMISEESFTKLSKEGDTKEILFDIDFTSSGINVQEERVTTVGEIKWLLNRSLAKKRFNAHVGGNSINLNRQNLKEHNDDKEL